MNEENSGREDDTEQATLTGGSVTRLVNRKRGDDFTVDIGRANGGRNHMNNTPVGKPGWLGNPYPKEEYGREECIERFREDFEERIESDEEFREAVRGLRGETLGCFCKPKSCHGDVILEYIRSTEGVES